MQVIHTIHVSRFFSYTVIVAQHSQAGINISLGVPFFQRKKLKVRAKSNFMKLFKVSNELVRFSIFAAHLFY